MYTLSSACPALAHVLLIEDNPGDADLIKAALGEEAAGSKFKVSRVPRIEEALRLLAREEFDVILLDLMLPDAENLQGLECLQNLVPETPIVVLTGLADDALALKALRKGAQDYLAKERLEGRLLVRTLRYAMERHEAQRSLEALAKKLRVDNASLERLALVDPLTELLNRRGLQQVLTRELRWAEREGELMVLMLDLDDFKQINDTLGYTAGDAVLKETAQKLKSALRSTDYAARIGGDEFMVLLPETRPAEGLRVAEKIFLALCGTPCLLPEGVLHVTASIGLVKAPDGVATLEDLISQAQLMLMESKEAGKNRISNNVPGAEVETGGLPSRSAILEAIRGGDLFRTLRQPMLRLSVERVEGYEFLSRWALEALEMPEDFFRYCRAANILTLVDRQCLKTCLAASSSLEPHLRCHVNLFPSTLIEVPPQELLEAFPKHRRMELYCLEVSERQLVGDPSLLVGPLGEFRKAGVRIGLDDVGFGRSSLEGLILLEPDFVKIDRKLVHGVALDGARERTLARIVKVAKTLNLETVAEGVETKEDLEVVKRLGLEWGQGRLWGLPA